jgi:hypothetical protein
VASGLRKNRRQVCRDFESVTGFFFDTHTPIIAAGFLKAFGNLLFSRSRPSSDFIPMREEFFGAMIVE